MEIVNFGKIKVTDEAANNTGQTFLLWLLFGTKLGLSIQ
jgi:hypothetical protein